MIQRIQSFDLLMAAAVSIMVFVNTLGISVAFSIAVAVCALFSFVNIFLYKNRKRQIKICYVNIILQLFALGIAVGGIMLQGKVFGLSIYIYLGLACVFVALAIYSIKKDEKLVKSLDRIR